MKINRKAAVGMAAALGVAALTANAMADPKSNPRVTEEEAKSLALSAVPGSVQEAELEDEKGKSVYSVEIQPTGGGNRQEVLIDSETGEVIAIEAGDTEQDGPENGEQHEDEDNENEAE